MSLRHQVPGRGRAYPRRQESPFHPELDPRATARCKQTPRQKFRPLPPHRQAPSGDNRPLLPSLLALPNEKTAAAQNHGGLQIRFRSNFVSGWIGSSAAYCTRFGVTSVGIPPASIPPPGPSVDNRPSSPSLLALPNEKTAAAQNHGGLQLRFRSNFVSGLIGSSEPTAPGSVSPR